MIKYDDHSDENVAHGCRCCSQLDAEGARVYVEESSLKPVSKVTKPQHFPVAVLHPNGTVFRTFLSHAVAAWESTYFNVVARIGSRSVITESRRSDRMSTFASFDAGFIPVDIQPNLPTVCRLPTWNYLRGTRHSRHETRRRCTVCAVRPMASFIP